MILTKLVPFAVKSLIKKRIEKSIRWRQLSESEQQLREQCDAMDDWIFEVENNLLDLISHACCFDDLNIHVSQLKNLENITQIKVQIDSSQRFKYEGKMRKSLEKINNMEELKEFISTLPKE